VQIQRLSWAGVRVEGARGALLIDALGDAEGVRPLMGEPADMLMSVGPADAALVTHLHPDHFDSVTLRQRVGRGWIACPTEVAEAVAASGLRPHAVEAWQTIDVAGFRCTAVPAVDGLGDPQVSWVVADGDTRIIHCGDTLWHGHWWRIAKRAGPFAVALLCINGARVRLPNLTPSGVEADLTPEQAVAAATVLGAELAVPIHYGLFDAPPTYEETPDAESRFLAAASARGVTTRLMAPGETLEVPGIGSPAN
jgi:L-ascorbate metabolism protein UlaG (beta-lactamase superfamily)